MTTQEVANRWATYCNTGQSEKAYQELYANHCISIEPAGVQGFPERAEGMAEIMQKGKMWEQAVETFHGMEIEGPIVADNFFTATMKMDITMKGMPRTVNEEVAVYRVENGKIVSEQFFYTVG